MEREDRRIMWSGPVHRLKHIFFMKVDGSILGGCESSPTKDQACRAFSQMASRSQCSYIAHDVRRGAKTLFDSNNHIMTKVTTEGLRPHEANGQ